MDILREKNLDNRIQLSFYNCSKQLAGDRWLVVLKLVSTLPLSDQMLAELCKLEEKEYLLSKFEGVLSFELERKRNFVDENEVGDILVELMDQAEQNLLSYLTKPNFADHLFLKRVKEFKEELLIEQNSQVSSKLSFDDDEPADFSACFK